MAVPPADPIASRFEVRATADSHMGWLRTRTQPRTHADVMDTHVGLLDWLRLHHRSVLPADGRPSRDLARPSSERASGSRVGADWLWRHGPVGFNLAVPLGNSLPLEWQFRVDRGCDEGGYADAAVRGCDSPDPDRAVCLLRRAVPYGLAARAMAMLRHDRRQRGVPADAHFISRAIVRCRACFRCPRGVSAAPGWRIRQLFGAAGPADYRPSWRACCRRGGACGHTGLAVTRAGR